MKYQAEKREWRTQHSILLEKIDALKDELISLKHEAAAVGRVKRKLNFVEEELCQSHEESKTASEKAVKSAEKVTALQRRVKTLKQKGKRSENRHEMDADLVRIATSERVERSNKAARSWENSCARLEIKNSGLVERLDAAQ